MWGVRDVDQGKNGSLYGVRDLWDSCPPEKSLPPVWKDVLNTHYHPKPQNHPSLFIRLDPLVVPHHYGPTRNRLRLFPDS